MVNQKSLMIVVGHFRRCRRYPGHCRSSSELRTVVRPAGETFGPYDNTYSSQPLSRRRAFWQNGKTNSLHENIAKSKAQLGPHIYLLRRHLCGRGIVVEHGGEPFFRFLQAPPLTPRVVLDLIALDLADA